MNIKTVLTEYSLKSKFDLVKFFLFFLFFFFFGIISSLFQFLVKKNCIVCLSKLFNFSTLGAFIPG